MPCGCVRLAFGATMVTYLNDTAPLSLTPSEDLAAVAGVRVGVFCDSPGSTDATKRTVEKRMALRCIIAFSPQRVAIMHLDLSGKQEAKYPPFQLSATLAQSSQRRCQFAAVQ